LTDDHAFKRLHTLFISACDKVGRNATPGPSLKGWFEEAGFDNVTHKVFRIPYGIWPRDKKLVCSSTFLSLCSPV
jgi:hypothetical protein